MKRSIMRRLLILGLAVLLIFSLASCGKSDEKVDTTDLSGTVSSVKEDGQGSEVSRQKTESEISVTSPLETDFFSVRFPDEWCDNCCYTLEYNKNGSVGYTVKFKINPMYRGNYDGWLFSLYVTDDYSTFYERFDDYVGLITDGESDDLYLIAEYPSGTQAKEEYINLYELLYGEISEIIDGVYATDTNRNFIAKGNGTSENNTDTANDIPSISVWSDYLDKTFSPKSTYMDVTRSCLSADGTANSAGVGSIYGAYAKSNVNYYWVDDGRNFRYYGVQNGTIVAYMDEVSDFNRNVRYYASDACLTVAPKIVTDGNWNYCMWELENGYIVMKVVKTASSYANWIVYTVAHFKDRDMCFWLSPNIEELIADRTAKMAEQERREQQEEQELSESKRKAEEEANALAEKRVKKELQQLIDNQYSDYVRIGETANGSINSYWVKVLSADKKQITLRIWNDTRLYDTPIDQTVKLTILSISNRPYSLSDASKIVEAGFANDISGYYECYLEHSPFRAEINAMDSNGNKGYQILIEENAITLNGFDPIKDKLGGIDFTNSPRYYY